MANENIVSKKGLSSRYRALIIFIAIFVISIVSVLTLNFFISSQFEKDAEDINIAGRQRMLSQRITKALFDIQSSIQSGSSIETPTSELEAASALFDSSLYAFLQGGETQDTSGQPTQLAAVQSDETKKSVVDAEKIWNEYQSRLDNLLSSNTDTLSKLSSANLLVSENNEQLLEDMNALTVLLDQEGAQGSIINLSGRQRLLTQKTAKLLFEISLSQENDEDLKSLLNELQNTSNLFTDTLNAFASGGMVEGADGVSQTVSALDQPGAQTILGRTINRWEPLRTAINSLTEDGDLSLQNLNQTLSFASRNNLDLLRLMNDLTTTLQNESQQRSSILRLIQVIGIAISLFMFFIILFYFMRQLRKSDIELDEAKAETDRIMSTVNNGLFLMDEEFKIGQQHSDSILGILNRTDIAGENFVSVLKKMVPEKTLSTAKDFLDLLFGDRVHEDLITDLNPLNEVEVHIQTGSGTLSTKYLEFGFKRTEIDEQSSQLLVQVEDVTKQVSLERELQASKEQSQKQFNLMLNVLHVEPKLLSDFFEDSEKSLMEINDALKERTHSEVKSREKLDRIFRIMHTIKGNASALGLDAFVEKADDFEDTLSDIRNSNKLDGDDFLPLAFKLNDFLSQIESLKSLISQLGELKEVVAGEEDMLEHSVKPSVRNTQDKPINLKMRNFTQRLADKQGKLATFSMYGENEIPQHYRKDIEEVLSQMLRNSMVHGIEMPKERFDAKKPEQGSIRAHFSALPGGGYNLKFHDDGRGLSPSKIKASAVKKGLISQAAADELSTRQIIALILKPGFSSADIVDQDAGRGVGLDVVLSNIKKLGGKLNLRYTENVFTEFIVTLPALANETTIDGEHSQCV
ncbi:MAG: type IV pili methyl-accepting chemotaxis transducer N-terminal domain-containing protein [Acidiferrobacterales bacterium]|nr:type IV pili methyl-accepting chemotaxis transducer N-terminal domain-containing protein [Acidiferrobacterales bacterium]